MKCPGASGNYYVAFSDYQDGKWLWSGPYSFSAGGGSTAITIPNSGQFVSPHAFIGNYFNATYLALAVKQGAALTNATVELGVHGLHVIEPALASVGHHDRGGPLGPGLLLHDVRSRPTDCHTQDCAIGGG